jgi:metal-sulfur cluster biosynthetic enzyme
LPNIRGRGYIPKQPPAIIRRAMLTQQDILIALRDCFDPVLPCNIVDLGLVRTVSVSPDPEAPGTGISGVPQKHLIRIETALSNPTDEAAAQLTAQIQNRLAGIEEAGKTTVVLVDHPVWSPQQITPAGRRILGLEGNPNLVQIR